MSSLSKNILQTLLVQIPNILLGLIAGIFITRLLGPEGKGVYAIFFANVEILVLFLSVGVNIGIVYFSANKKIQLKKIAGIAFWLLLISSIFAAVIIFSVKDEQHYLFPEGHDDSIFKWFLISTFIVSFTNSILNSFHKGQKEFKRINIIILINSILSVSAFSVFYFAQKYLVFEMSIQNILLISIGIMLLNSVLWIISYIDKIKIIPQLFRITKQELALFFKYTSISFLGMVVNFLSYRLDIWIVSYYRGAEELGYYALAVGLAQFMLLFSKTMSSVIMPYLSEQETSERRRTYILFSKLNTSLVLLFFLGFFILGQYIIPFLYGEAFLPSVSPFYILIFAMLFTCMNQIQTTYFASNDMNMYCLYANIVGVIATLVLDLILIPKFGIIGAAYASLCSYALNFMVLYVIQVFKIEKNFVNIFIVNRKDIKEILFLFKFKRE